MRLTINFLMKKARMKSNGEIPIYVRVPLNSRRVELSTGIYCLPETRDETGQQIRGRNEKARVLNNRLNKIEDDIQDHYNQLKSSGDDFDVTTIKNRFLNIDDSEGILKVFDLDLQQKVGQFFLKNLSFSEFFLKILIWIKI
nr:Arm DNA-binding domain-containing protein [uncultured Draconibacterium sp.]